MATTVKSLYDTDFQDWTAQTAELLRRGRFHEVDLEHVAEEIEDLGKRDWKAVRSQLRRMLMHLIKRKIQPERDGPSWSGSIDNARQEILDALRDSPSLRRRLSHEMGYVYESAIDLALAQTGLTDHRAAFGLPGDCPFTLSQLLDGPVDLLHF
jgi:hypothetical protein